MTDIQHSGKVGFWGGFLLSLSKSLFLSDVLETVVYATLGTIVSFFVSMLLRYWFGRMKDS